jgi:hypothetical protein
MPIGDTIGPAPQGAAFDDWLRNILTPAGSDRTVLEGLASIPGSLSELAGGGLRSLLEGSGLHPDQIQDTTTEDAMLINRGKKQAFQDEILNRPPQSDRSLPPPNYPGGTNYPARPTSQLATLIERPQPKPFVGPPEVTGPPEEAAQDIPILGGGIDTTMVQDLPQREMTLSPSGPRTDSAQGGGHKSHLLSNILKAMGLLAGGVALHKFGGPGALEGGIGGLASGWAQTKKQLIDEQRQMDQKSLQRNLDDAHEIMQRLMTVDTSSMPDLHDALQNYVKAFTGKTAPTLVQARALKLATAEHAREIQNLLTQQSGRGAYEGAYQGARGREAAEAETAKIPASEAATGNYMLTREEAARLRAQREGYTHQDTLQRAGFGHAERMQDTGAQRMAIMQYNQELNQARRDRAQHVLRLQTSRGPMQIAITPQEKAQWEAEAQRLYPDPTPPSGLGRGNLGGLVATPPPNQPAPSGGEGGNIVTTPDGLKWQRTPDGRYMQVQ